MQTFTKIISIIVLSFCTLTNGLAYDLTWYQQSTKTVLKNARKLIEPTLPPNERAIANSITYKVSSSPGIGAFAAFDDNERIIIISAGTIQIIDWIQDLLTMEAELDKPGCYSEFLIYLNEIMETNALRISNHLPPQPAMSPLVYSAHTDGACSGVTIEDFQELDNFNYYKAKAIEASIMFMYLHELGHHVLNHVKNKHIQEPENLAMSRSKENAADQYAIVTALHANYNLVAAAPWNYFMAAFGGGSLEAEKKSDHPLGVKRVLSIYDNAIIYYTDNPGAWKDPTTYDDLMAGLKKQRDLIKEQINNIEP
ncbi:M48 family metalloprotease [Pseudomonas oryziphila]|uniref:Uncharacterized protein n=1 Tax=Pseudomonas entomophila TaxID=312306 RepID=A0A3S8UI73_9PSED|nr:hypothetical protein [Pseudomonas oryziphila]AZL67976.1 hypothetical protein EJA05_09590 [Pseudomonas oryziphila]